MQYRYFSLITKTLFSRVTCGIICSSILSQQTTAQRSMKNWRGGVPDSICFATSFDTIATSSSTCTFAASSTVESDLTEAAWESSADNAWTALESERVFWKICQLYGGVQSFLASWSSERWIHDAEDLLKKNLRRKDEKRIWGRTRTIDRMVTRKWQRIEQILKWRIRWFIWSNDRTNISSG